MNPSHTVKLHRVFSAPIERVFKAFIDPDALVKWMPRMVLLPKFSILMHKWVVAIKCLLQTFQQAQAILWWALSGNYS